jgi:hypothetical protein
VSRHRRKAALIKAAAEILASLNPMTVRQVFYRLVSGPGRRGFCCRRRWMIGCRNGIWRGLSLK